MAQQFIEHLPGGHLRDVLPSALEVLKKQVNEQELEFTAEISLKEVFSRIDRECGAVHSEWYVKAYEECMLCAQGEDEMLIDYVQRVESMSLKTQSSKNTMYRHVMRDVKEQASLKKNLNSVMGKMINSSITALERDHMYNNEYDYMLCSCATCPHACANALAGEKCCFKPFRDLEKEYYKTKVPVEHHLQGLRENQGFQGQPKGALKKRSSSNTNLGELRHKIHVNNVEITTALKGMSDPENGTAWTFENRHVNAKDVQEHLVKLFGNGDTHETGPKFIPTSKKELIAIKKMLSPSAGVCFTCFSKDHQKAQCPHAVAEGVKPKQGSWADFERLRWAKPDNKGKQGHRSGRNKGSRSN